MRLPWGIRCDHIWGTSCAGSALLLARGHLPEGDGARYVISNGRHGENFTPTIPETNPLSGTCGISSASVIHNSQRVWMALIGYCCSIQQYPPPTCLPIVQVESGAPAVDVCRQIGCSEVSFFLWKKRYGNLEMTEVKEFRQLRDENARLKRRVADLTLDKDILSEVVRKSL